MFSAGVEPKEKQKAPEKDKSLAYTIFTMTLYLEENINKNRVHVEHLPADHLSYSLFFQYKQN